MRNNVEITKECYDKLCNSSEEDIKSFVLNIACKTIWQPQGYGFWNAKIFEKNEHYYASWEHLVSCD